MLDWGTLKMRAITMISVAAFAVATTAASAQVKATRTPAEIVCELTGDCTAFEAEEGQKLDKPEEAGFSLYRPGTKANSAKPAAAAKSTAPKAASASSGAVAPKAAGAKPKQKPALASAKKPAAPAKARSGLDMMISFNLGSAEMTPQGRAEAEQFAKALKDPQLASKRFVIEGHTDAIGDRSYNMQLSQERAEAVAAYLSSLGIDRDRLVTKGYGFDKPLPGTPARSAENRRVELVPAS
jgi:outer membrane protein OmpA-like peptidoglycan-associated protein